MPTEHHTTEVELPSILLIPDQGRLMQDTSADIQQHEDTTYWYIDQLGWCAAQTLDLWSIRRTLLGRLDATLAPLSSDRHWCS